MDFFGVIVALIVIFAVFENQRYKLFWPWGVPLFCIWGTFSFGLAFGLFSFLDLSMSQSMDVETRNFTMLYGCAGLIVAVAAGIIAGFWTVLIKHRLKAGGLLSHLIGLGSIFFIVIFSLARIASMNWL